MKHTKRILAVLLAVAMVLAMGTSVFAVTVNSGNGGSASITITLPTTAIAPTGTTTYKVYKVFDATSDGTSSAIAYTARHNAALPTGFVKDSAGNIHHGTIDADGNVTEDKATALTEAEISAIAAYVRDPADLVYTATVAAGETSVTITGLEYGYYYITTSTGTVVTVDSTNPTASVNDKNVIPPVVKSAGTQYDAASLNAIAAVGTKQSFTAQITKTKGATNLVFTDTMTNMSYNGDVVITVSAGTAPTATQAVVATTATGFTVTFDNNYISGLADGTKITLVYSGTITSDALSVNPATNKATLKSGDGNTYESEEVKVYNAKFTVTKQDGDKKPLAGAGFVIKNADGAYYKLNAATGTAPASITWYKLSEGQTLAQAIAAGNVTEYTSNAQGVVTPFTGLADGTYTLVESTTPAGYNTAADYNFTISGTDYTTTNLEQGTTVTNESGTELPSTGGIGTTIFYIVGAVLVLGAGVVLVSRRRMHQN
ncbi:MAG: SpaA isopeptide-forming pilin-related protein [Bacillota bacterium]